MVFEFIERYNLEHELHLNRTRFWVPVETSDWIKNNPLGTGKIVL